MRTAPTPDLLLTAMRAELKVTPRPVFLCFAALGLFSAGAAFVIASHKPSPPLIAYGAALFEFAASFAATYSACVWMVGGRQSWPGFGRYFATYLAMASPLAIGLALYSLTSGDLFAAMIALALVLTAGFALTFLPAWPLLQATSGPVGAQAAFEATRGIRWQLFSVSCMISALGSLPALFKVETVMGAGLLAVLEGVMTCASLMLTTAVAVAAWKYMTGQIADRG
jgi:hypothetical protein